ncbi:DUF2203 domain-containing protein [Paenibacillus oenotherae]|uniref:DUF2203 domain-containing protein n=1 Tax=Paenibacillus oenotherae TaxID=1435645 RepID=A0ABS7D6D4_9BACL|nr:DUF2203 domain-containing protein [Paenibacillus oenotherae]MBW7475404.1 DUF2203 domain-containing protein [Paenibacillus oenotherae]
MVDKIFTLEEANELLPELKENLQKLQALTDHYERQYRELQQKRLQHEPSPVSTVEDPFFEAEGQLEFMRIEVDLLVENFIRRGVMLKMISPGLIDFPAVLDGEEVLICWKEGEERITHYHGWNEGFIGRKEHPEA